MPSDTRWGSSLAYRQSVLKPENLLPQLVTERCFLTASTIPKKASRRAVFDFVTGKDLASELEKAVQVLEPLAKYQRRFEKDRAVPLDVFEMVLSLPDEIASEPLSASE
ncbi:hypothetical protein PF008_g2375 [Phytophthora fragariae]|uniref:Uncharacterized protein n=1 Tax=Phytophthora fragariae TaxID=53985 RepID=A0A6G0SHC4_9STRA|nr:hypothetical protein PF008_g2375 [Phytophthora fragariae]